MATVHIPAALRPSCDGRTSLEVEAATLGEALLALEKALPAMRQKLRHEESIAPGWAASIDGVIASQGLRTRLAAESHIYFHPAIGGG